MAHFAGLRGRRQNRHHAGRQYRPDRRIDPSGNDYDREIVIVSTLRLDHIQVLDNGKQVVGFPGSTLHHLEKLLKPYGREPHSVIGSSCIGASVIGGVCNNSGGSLVKRGPAYTEMALYAQLGEDGQLRLVNHLGIRLGDTPEGSSPGWKRRLSPDRRRIRRAARLG